MRDFTDYEHMAMFDLREPEHIRLMARFEEIISGFSGLDAIDTGAAEPLVSVLDLSNIMRDDISVKLLPGDELLKNAPESYNGYFQVPAAID